MDATGLCLGSLGKAIWLEQLDSPLSNEGSGKLDRGFDNLGLGSNKRGLGLDETRAGLWILEELGKVILIRDLALII